MKSDPEYLSATAAAVAIDGTQPPSADTMRRLHGRVEGPRDSSGRRIFTRDVVNRIKALRASRVTARR